MLIISVQELGAACRGPRAKPVTKERGWHRAAAECCRAEPKPVVTQRAACVDSDEARSDICWFFAHRHMSDAINWGRQTATVSDGPHIGEGNTEGG